MNQELIHFETVCNKCGQIVLRRASHQGGGVFEPAPDSNGIWYKHDCPGLPKLPAIPEDITFALEQKKKYFWELRGNVKTRSSFGTHVETRFLLSDRRRRGVLHGFDSYREELAPLVDEAVAAFVQIVPRLEDTGFQDRITLVRNHVHDCLIEPTVKRDSIVRWLAEACGGSMPLETLLALHDDPDNWIAPKWLTPPRVKIKRTSRGWFLVAGSKRTRVSKQFAEQHRRRLESLPANLATIDLVNDLESTLEGYLGGALDRALAKCIEKLLPVTAVSPGKPRANDPISHQSPVQEYSAVVIDEESSPAPSIGTDSPLSQQPTSQCPEPGKFAQAAVSQAHIPVESQVILYRTYFILDAEALVHSKDRPGELVAAYSTKDPYVMDANLLCFANSARELSEKLRNICADQQKLLIHWDKSEQALKEFPSLLRLYLSLKETAKTFHVKHLDDAVQHLRSSFQDQRKKRGRPRQDALREMVRALRGGGLSWGKIQRKLNHETGVQRSLSAYRNLVSPRNKNLMP